MKQFILNNKVFLIGLLSAIYVAVKAYVGQPTIQWTAIEYAGGMAVLSYVANQWAGQGLTILGVIGTLAGTAYTLSTGGTFTWPQFLLSGVAAVIAACAGSPTPAPTPPPVPAPAKLGAEAPQKPKLKYGIKWK